MLLCQSIQSAGYPSILVHILLSKYVHACSADTRSPTAGPENDSFFDYFLILFGSYSGSNSRNMAKKGQGIGIATP